VFEGRPPPPIGSARSCLSASSCSSKSAPPPHLQGPGSSSIAKSIHHETASRCAPLNPPPEAPRRVRHQPTSSAALSRARYGRFLVWPCPLTLLQLLVPGTTSYASRRGRGRQTAVARHHRPLAA